MHQRNMGDKTPFLTLNYAQTGHFNLFKRIVLSHLNIKYIVIAYDEWKRSERHDSKWVNSTDNETEQKAKPIELKKQKKQKYNLEHLFDDDSFSDNEIEPFDNKMREIYWLKRKTSTLRMTNRKC